MMAEFVKLETARRARDTKAKKAPPAATDDGRPVIRLDVGAIEEIVDKSEAAMIDSNDNLFQRGEKIVSVERAKRITADKREITVHRIFERGEHALLEDLAKAARFEKWDARSHSYTRTNATMSIVKTLRERTGRLRFPVLVGVITGPTLRPDGSLLATPGYDEATNLLFNAGQTVFPPIPVEPTRADAETALDRLSGLVASFPYVGAADQAVALSAMLTAPVRRSLRTAPLHGFSAPVAGSGKSMLVDVVSVIATGREAGVIAQGKSEEETEKRLGSMFLAGDQVITLDNCTHPLGGDFLCQVMTQTTVRTRILGKSETPELPTGAFCAATGNNLRFLGDMNRRALLCSLDPKVERPENRRFSVNPVAAAKKDRGAYLAASLTILRAYVVAGRPKQVDPLGSFEEWSDLVRSALIWLGCADPCATMEAARERDPELEKLQFVMSQWASAIGTKKVTARDVITKATEKSPFLDMSVAGFKLPEFREALLAVAGDGGAINSRRLGNWLSGVLDRMVAAAPEDEEEGKSDRETQFSAEAELKRCNVMRYFRRGCIRGGSMTWSLEETRQTLPATKEFA